jgi:hypothetical protein
MEERMNMGNLRIRFSSTRLKASLIRFLSQGPSSESITLRLRLKIKFIFLEAKVEDSINENFVFKDLWVLDIENLTWSELKSDCKKYLYFFNLGMLFVFRAFFSVLYSNLNLAFSYFKNSFIYFLVNYLICI